MYFLDLIAFSIEAKEKWLAKDEGMYYSTVVYVCSLCS